MENLFSKTLYAKRLIMCKAEPTDDVQQEQSADTGLMVSKVGENDRATMQSSSGDLDSVIIDGKSTDVYGTLTDANVSEALGNGFSEYSKDILDKMREIIWSFRNYFITKSTDPDPMPDDDPITDPDLTTTTRYESMSRGDAKKQLTIEANTVTELTLTNPFTGIDYKYNITSNNGEQIDAEFNFLDNGRLVVTGDNLKIVASNGQKDDLIVIGDYNDIDTGDEDDTVRVGLVIDNSYDGYYLSEEDAISTNYSYITYDDGTEKRFYFATGNRINTGSGNDYVTMLGENYTVNMGSGSNDSFLSLNPDKITTSIATDENATIKNAETVTRQYGIQSADDIDSLDGWVRQGNDGDCRLLAIINSFCGNTNTGNLKDKLNISISRNGNNITVTFGNYDTKKFGGKNSVTFSEDELSQFEGAYGDADTLLVDIALNKLIKQNNDFENRYSGETVDTDVENATYNTLSRYLTGSSEITYLSNIEDWKDYENDYLTEERFLECWNLYNQGNISNIGIGLSDTDYSLGIIGGHAYSLKYVNVNSRYVELINPWDDKDVLRITLDNLFSMDIDLIVYGTDIYNQNLLVPNGGSIYILQENGAISSKSLVTKRMDNSNNLTLQNNSDSSNPFSGYNNIQTTASETEIQEEIQDIENKINLAKSIFLIRKKNGEVSA